MDTRKNNSRQYGKVLTGAVLSACLLAAVPLAVGQGTQPDSLAQTINQAADPSSAIQAYAKASVTSPVDIDVEQAYVHRMVAFGLPEMAELQAGDLTQRAPQDGEAWAVAAYMNAKRNQSVAGLVDLQMAVKNAPNDPFVLHTAGQMLAWYDTRADKSHLDAGTQASVETLRRSLASKAGYADAYSKATAMYGQLAAQSAPNGNQSQVARAVPPPVPEYSPYTPGSYAEPGYTLTPPAVIETYPDPYYAYDPYDYWYPGPYADFGWWPSFGFGFIGDADDFHHGHDHDRDHDGDFRRGSGNFNHAGGSIGRPFDSRAGAHSSVAGSSGRLNGGNVANSANSSIRARTEFYSGARFTGGVRSNLQSVQPGSLGSPRMSGPSLGSSFGGHMGGGGMHAGGFGGGGSAGGHGGGGHR